MAHNKYTASEIIEAIRGTGKYAKADKHTGCMGIVSRVAERLGCNWHTAKKYCTRGKTPFITAALAFEDEAEQALDFAETKMYSIIQAGDGPMIRYLLSTKGKHRGFTERHEVTGAEGKPIETKTNVTGLDKGIAEAMALLDTARKRADVGNSPPDNE